MLEKILDKIQPLSLATSLVQQWRSDGQRVIWTNGVFDLLHPGHIKYLCAARDLGDKLIVGINSDESVRRLKGEGRPINNEASRLLQMGALQMVDLVVLFAEDTPLECILALRPMVIAKGGDYDPEEVVGGSEAKSWDGRVEILPFEAGHSSSHIIEKIQGKQQ